MSGKKIPVYRQGERSGCYGLNVLSRCRGYVF